MTFILFCKKGDFAVVDWALLILMAGIFRIHSYFNTDIKYDFICHQKNRRVTYSIYCWFLSFRSLDLHWLEPIYQKIMFSIAIEIVFLR